MKRLGLPLFIKPPDGFVPRGLTLNYLLARAALETWVENRLRDSRTWTRHLYPLPWHKAYGGANDTIFKAARYWAIFLPILVGLTSSLPFEVQFSGFKFSIGGHFDLALPFKLSFVSALLFIAALIIRSIFGPQFIAEHPRKFVTLPEAMTRKQLHTSYILFCTRGMPRTIKSGEFSFVRSAAGTYDIGFALVYQTPYGTEMLVPGGNVWGIFSYLCWRCSSPAQWMAIVESPEFFAYAPNWLQGQEPIMSKESLDVLAENGKTIIEIDEMGLERVSCEFVYPKQISAIFPILFASTALIDGREAACYQHLYGFWDHASPIARAAFWCCYLIASALGLIVTINLLLRGFKVIF